MFRTQAMYRDNLPFDGNATVQYNPVYYTAHYIIRMIATSIQTNDNKMLNNREIIFLKTLRQPDSENDIIITYYISHDWFSFIFSKLDFFLYNKSRFVILECFVCQNKIGRKIHFFSFVTKSDGFFSSIRPDHFVNRTTSLHFVFVSGSTPYPVQSHQAASPWRVHSVVNFLESP